jgi:hypothetical protein
VGWTLALRSTELDTFRHCPRAWDLGSRSRQNRVPIVPPEVFDFDRAIRDAQRLLELYFAWCVAVDDFECVLCDHELRAPVPDLSVAGRDLVSVDERAARDAGSATVRFVWG